MKIGATLVSTIVGPPTPDYPFARWISDVEKLVTIQEAGGFNYLAFTHAYHQTGLHGFQPLMLMARLATMTGMRLSTEILQLPVYSAMDAAYNISSLDHITEGRIEVGLGIGYNPREIGPAGVGNADRVPKFEENVEVMRRFWTGEPVHYQGRYCTIEGTRLELLPVQKPHPPLWGAAYSNAAAARAGRMLDGVIAGPFQRFDDMGIQLDAFRGAWSQFHSEEPTRVGAWRTIIAGKDPKDAVESLIASGRQTFARNIQGGMQEKTTATLRMNIRERDQSDWAVLGNYEDCLESLARCRDEYGLTHVTCHFKNIPDDIDARCEYMQGFGEEVVRKLKA